MAPGAEMLAAIGLAGCRLAGVAAFAPAIAAPAVPGRVRAGVAFVLAVAALPAIAAHGVPAAAVAEPWRLLPAAAVEFALGAVIGVIAMLPVAAFRTAGSLVGAQAGIGFGTLAGADAGDDEDDAIARLLGVLGAACFVWAGGLEAVALASLRSFDHLAIGAWLPAGGATGVVGVVTGAMLASSELAFRVALPVTAVLVAEALVSGVVARSVPGVGALAFGFPVRVAVALLALLAGAAAMQSAMGGAIGGALDAVQALVKGAAQ